jgi:2-dehydropantoate 2-reductase
MDTVHIVGAGGIGSAVGYALLSAGAPVVFVETNERKLRAVRQGGLQVDDRPPLKVDVVPFREWQPPAGAWVLLCTKCYDNASVLERLSPDVRLLPIQNGFDPGLEAFGHSFEGIASFVAQADSSSLRTRITRPGSLHIGRKGQAAVVGHGPKLLTDALAQSNLFRTELVPDIDPFKHTKLMYNAAISPLAAASGIDNGQLLSLPVARKLFFALIQENYRILAAAGIELGKVGPFHPSTVAWILRRNWLAAGMARMFEPSLRGTYCSMAGEIQKGRTEIDNYNGYLLRLATESGTPAELNQAVYDLVTEMTARRDEPGPARLDELARTVFPVRSLDVTFKQVAG